MKYAHAESRQCLKSLITQIEKKNSYNIRANRFSTAEDALIILGCDSVQACV